MGSSPIADLAFDSQIAVVMQEVIGGLDVNAEEQVPDRPEQRAFARLIGTVNDMEITEFLGELEI